MKRFNFILGLVFALSLLVTSSCLAVFPKPDDYTNYNMMQGWYQDDLAWYIHYDNATNDINFVNWGGSYTWLSTKLSSALEGETPAARPLYIVLNFDQGPIFSAAPGDDEYSGLWQVFYVTWHEGFARPITNSDPATLLNPQGVPDIAEADIEETEIVIQYPIVALGRLDGPWYPAPAGKYRLKQALAYPGYTYTKTIYLPLYYIYCMDEVTKRLDVQRVVIPDVGDSTLADLLGANLAPGLLNVPESDTSDFWYMNNPKPVYQYPVVQKCLEDHPNNFNLFTDYSPVVRYVVLNRLIPPYITVKSPAYLQLLLDSHYLVIDTDTQRMGILIYQPLLRG